MFTKDHGSSGWWMLLALIGALGLVLAGCPEQGDDDDDDTADDDDDVSDDDASDDDASDDDAGDDDTQMGDGSGTWTITAATDCGEVRSVIYYEGGERGFSGIFASSAPLTCADWNTADAAMEKAYDTWQSALTVALSKQDGPGACAASLAYYTELEQYDSTLWPAGSCTLEMHPDYWENGDYNVGMDARGTYLSLYGTWYVALESYFQGHVDFLTTECPNVTTWAEWENVEYDLWYQGGDSEFWDLSSGTVTIKLGDPLAASSQTSIELFNWDNKQTGNLEFDLAAANCAP